MHTYSLVVLEHLGIYCSHILHLIFIRENEEVFPGFIDTVKKKIVKLLCNNWSSKNGTWPEVPNALLGVIS